MALENKLGINDTAGLEQGGKERLSPSHGAQPHQVYRKKVLLKAALTEAVDDAVVYMKGIDASYHYKG